MLIKWRKTALFGSLLDHTRGLLLLTMPSAHLRNPEIALDHSLGSQAQSLSSYVTASSGFFPGLLVPRGAAGERRNRRGTKKKTAHMAESISDEEKSQEYKAFEAFTAAHFSEHHTHQTHHTFVFCAGLLSGQPQLDTSDITGQEDPLLLHAVIATLPATQAHKEGKTL